MLLHALFGMLLALAADEAPRKRPAPLYTNADLDRVRPFRDQTGVASTPAARREQPEPGADDRRKREGHWRREAERLADRLRPLRQRAAQLRRQIEERRMLPGVRTLSDPKLGSWLVGLADLEATIHELESRFEERARREGALPGWLR